MTNIIYLSHTVVVKYMRIATSVVVSVSTPSLKFIAYAAATRYTFYAVVFVQSDKNNAALK